MEAKAKNVPPMVDFLPFPLPVPGPNPWRPGPFPFGMSLTSYVREKTLIEILWHKSFQRVFAFIMFSTIFMKALPA